MKLPMDSGTSSGDLMDCENPADILAVLLRQLGGSTSISTLCKVVCVWGGGGGGEGRGERGRGEWGEEVEERGEKR